MLKICLSLLLLASLVESKLKVVYPRSLKKQFKDGEISAGLGNFGHLIYGQIQTGRLHYPAENRDGCHQFKESDFRNDMMFDEEDDMNPIILIDRGNCPFVRKVRHIEEAGVKLAIIADNREEDT